MADVPRSQLAVYVAAAIAIALLGARYVAAQDAAPPQGGTAAVQVEEKEDDGEGGRAVVHVAGAVREPGVYRLREGDRVADAVDRAGGATGRADLTLLNLAAEVEDGRQVVVPQRGAAAVGAPAGSGAPATGASGVGATGGAAPPVNLNTATLEQLDTLEGVGPGIAQRILDYRDEQGSFGSVDELGQVPGIGEKRMATLRDKVTV